jgi:hypothetical protein
MMAAPAMAVALRESLPTVSASRDAVRISSA